MVTLYTMDVDTGGAADSDDEYSLAGGGAAPTYFLNFAFGSDIYTLPSYYFLFLKLKQ